MRTIIVALLALLPFVPTGARAASRDVIPPILDDAANGEAPPASLVADPGDEPAGDAYAFSFSDGMATVDTPPDTALIGGGAVDETEVVTVELVSPQTSTEDVRLECALGGAHQGLISIYDVGGRLVRRISLVGARWTATWDLRDEGGRRVASGVYFIRLSSVAGSDQAKLVLVR